MTGNAKMGAYLSFKIAVKKTGKLGLPYSLKVVFNFTNVDSHIKM